MTTLTTRYLKYLTGKEWVSKKHLVQLAQTHGYVYNVIQKELDELEEMIDVGTWWLSEPLRTDTGVMLRGGYVKYYALTEKEKKQLQANLDWFDAYERP